MDTRAIEMAGASFEVPEYYQQVQSMPEDPEGSVPLMVQTESSMCFVLVFPTGSGDRMPYDQEAVIGGIREAMADNQGIIEVEADASASSPYVYSIVKDLGGQDGRPDSLQYILTMDIGAPNGTVHVQGFFDAIGTTGLRDTLIYSTLRNEGKVGPDLDGWMRDPYDPEWEYGKPMNLSEQRCYDALFPDHPLSMARALIECMVG